LTGTTGLQDVDDDQGSNSSGQSDGSGVSNKGKKKQKNRQSSNSASSAEGFVEVEGDEPAQLMTMLPVSGWFQSFDVSSCILPNDQ